jgi:hypothetical protein
MMHGQSPLNTPISLRRWFAKIRLWDRIFLLAAFAAVAASGFYAETLEGLDIRKWSYGDPICAVLFLVSIVSVLLRRWRLDLPAFMMAGYLATMAVSGLYNETLTKGTFLNFARNATWGLGLYVVGLNTVRTKATLEQAYQVAALFCAFLVASSMISMPTLWSSGFHNLVPLVGGLSLNEFGFIVALLFTFLATWWAMSPHSLIRGAVLVLALAGVGLSFSRSAYSNVIIAGTILALGTARKQNLKAALLAVLTVIGLMSVQGELMNLFPETETFWEEKVATYGSEVRQLRLVELNVEPVLEWATQPTELLLMGDGITFQHSLVPSTLWMTGLLGAIFMGLYYFGLLRNAVELWRKWPPDTGLRINLGIGFFALILIMFLNDLIANHRNHSAVICYLFGLTSGVFSGVRQALIRKSASAAASPIQVIRAAARVQALSER